MYVHIALKKKLIRCIVSNEGIAIVVQTFVEVPLKLKGMILCNNLIDKTIPYFILRALR
jgi:hypothetical protein